MKKINPIVFVLTFGVLILFASCSHKINKDLSASDMDSFIKKDTLYKSVIDVIKEVNDTLLKNQILYSKYEDVTYEEVYEYFKELNDTTSDFNKQIKEKEKVILSKFKKTIDMKLKHYKDIYPGNFFSVEFVGTDITFYEYIAGVDNGYFKFKITPKNNNKINGCGFRYEIYDRINNKPIEYGSCKTLESFTKSYIGLWDIPYSYKDEFGYKTITKIKEQYSFKFIPLSVNINNKIYEIDPDSLSFGYQALLFLKYNIDYSSFGVMKDVFEEKDKKNLDVYYLSICYKEHKDECLKILDEEKERELLNPKIFNLLRVVKTNN